MAFNISALPDTLFLGNQGEVGANEIEINVGDWVTLYPAGTFAITYTRSGSDTVYPESASNVSVTGDTLTWTPGEALLDVPGRGTVVFVCTENSVVKKSCMAATIVGKGHAAAGDPPEPLASYIEKWGAVDVEVTEKPADEELTQAVTQDEEGTHFALQIHKGNGIASIVRTAGTGAPGTVDTYTIAFDDGTEQTYQVAHGAQGVSAYAQAFAGGYAGDEAAFNADLAALETAVEDSEAAQTAAEAARDLAEGYRDDSAGYAAQLAAGVASPAGTYATLVALEAAFPTGDTHIYVVSADGHWYYWSGSAWADGGVYLSSDLDPRLTIIENKFIRTVNNIFADGRFENGSTGWGTSNAAVVSAVDDELTFLASAVNGKVESPAFALTNGRKYYVRYDVYADVGASLSIDISGANAQAFTGTGAYATTQRLVDWSSGNGNWKLRFLDKRASGWTNVKITNLLIIDLTADFGAGSEPVLADMPYYLPVDNDNWFDGTYDYAPDADAMLDAFVDVEEAKADILSLGIESAEENLATSFTDGRFYEGKGRLSSANASYSYTSFIPVKPATTYIRYPKIGLAYSVACFGADQIELATPNNLIDDTAGASPFEFTTPAGCYYIVANFNVSSQPTAYIIEKRTDDKLKLSGMPDAVSDFDATNMSGATPAWANIAEGCDYSADNLWLNSAGAEAALTGSHYTDYIEILPNTDYIINLARHTVSGHYYDVEKNRITYIGTNSSTSYEFTTPYNAAYARFNFVIADFPELIVVEKSLRNKYTIPWIHSPYVPAPEETSPLPVSTIGTNSFIGAHNWVFDKLLTAKPTARIIMITHYSEDNGETEEARFYRRLLDQQEAIAAYWGIPVCKVYEKSGWVCKNGFNIIEEFASDGIHPDTASFQVLADIIVPFLESFISSPSGKKVAWYGTSIPARNNSYADLAAATLGFTLYNYSVGSGCMRLTKYNEDALGIAYHPFTSLSEGTNYQVSMLDKIGTADEPDYYVFDYGVNDIYGDETDFNLFDKDNQY